MKNLKAYLESTSQKAGQDAEKVVGTSGENEEQGSSEDDEDVEFESVSNDDDSH